MRILPLIAFLIAAVFMSVGSMDPSYAGGACNKKIQTC